MQPKNEEKPSLGESRSPPFHGSNLPEAENKVFKVENVRQNT